MTELWVKSDVHADGRYGITIQLGDRVRGLSVDEAYRHARAVLVVAQRAEYDAAVLRQLAGKLALEPDIAATTVMQLREARPPVDPAETWPVELVPGASLKMVPFITVVVGGQRIGQWTVGDARTHALTVLEMTEAVALDQAYFDYLVAEIDVDEARARQVVEDIANFRGAP